MSEAITFEIERHLGVLESFQTGWSKELNVVSWNGGAAKYDIRDWSSDHTKMSKGITLTRKQVSLMMDILEEELENGF